MVRMSHAARTLLVQLAGTARSGGPKKQARARLRALRELRARLLNGLEIDQLLAAESPPLEVDLSKDDLALCAELCDAGIGSGTLSAQQCWPLLDLEDLLAAPGG